MMSGGWTLAHSFGMNSSLVFLGLGFELRHSVKYLHLSLFHPTLPNSSHLTPGCCQVKRGWSVRDVRFRVPPHICPPCKREYVAGWAPVFLESTKKTLS